jgi:hypothetical protein
VFPAIPLLCKAGARGGGSDAEVPNLKTCCCALHNPETRHWGALFTSLSQPWDSCRLCICQSVRLSSYTDAQFWGWVGHDNFPSPSPLLSSPWLYLPPGGKVLSGFPVAATLCTSLQGSWSQQVPPLAPTPSQREPMNWILMRN